MKQGSLSFKLIAWFLLITFTTLQIAWAEEPVPSVAQIPKDLRPLTDPKTKIPDRPPAFPPQPLPESPLGVRWNSLEFLKESPPLSSPDQRVEVGETLKRDSLHLPEPVQEAEKKPNSYPGLGGIQIHLIVRKQKKPGEETRGREKPSEKAPTARPDSNPWHDTGNLNGSMPWIPKDLRPAVEREIEWKSPEAGGEKKPLPAKPLDPPPFKDYSESPSEMRPVKVEPMEPLQLTPVPEPVKRESHPLAGFTIYMTRTQEKRGDGRPGPTTGNLKDVIPEEAKPLQDPKIKSPNWFEWRRPTFARHGNTFPPFKKRRGKKKEVFLNQGSLQGLIEANR